MSILFDRVVQLLGQSIDDPAIDRLADDLGETPWVIMMAEKNAEIYVYYFHGFFVQCQETLLHGCWMTVVFSVGDSEEKFPGKLPFGLLPTDTRKEVQRKLNIAPTPINKVPYYRRNRPDNEMLNFDLPPYEAFCGFADQEPYTLSTIGVGVRGQELGAIMLARYDYELGLHNNSTNRL